MKDCESRHSLVTDLVPQPHETHEKGVAMHEVQPHGRMESFPAVNIELHNNNIVRRSKARRTQPPYLFFKI